MNNSIIINLNIGKFLKIQNLPKPIQEKKQGWFFDC